MGLHSEGPHETQRLSRVSRVWRAAAVSRRDAWRVLRVVSSFGEQGEFISPGQIAVLPDGLCVADSLGGRLRIFSGTDHAGQHSRTIAVELPCGLAYADGALYVSDQHERRLTKLRLTDGALLQSTSLDGHIDGGLN